MLTIEQGIRKLPNFLEQGITSVAKSFKTGSTFGGLGGTHPPKTYSSTPPPFPES